MKKSILLTALIFVFTQISLIAQVKVNSSGFVGINNTNPTYRLDIGGNVKMAYNGYTLYFTGVSFYPTGNIDLGISGNYWYRLYATTAFLTYQPVITSDEKFKTNVKNLELMKDKLQLLRPVSYDLKIEDPAIKTDPNRSFQYGFIAQELQEVFPEMVIPREDGVLGISYTELIPVLVQAIKEQQEEIDGLKKRLEAVENSK